MMNFHFTTANIFLFLLLLLCGSNAIGKTMVLVTVDTESFYGGTPKSQIWGKLDGYSEPYGITKIMDVMDKYNRKATFYLNVYEIAKHGEGPIKEAAIQIHQRGHDLQLHTHPAHMYGKHRLASFILEKQKEVLQKGIDLIKDWTGKEVIAHRAGAFAANLDTIKASRQLNLKIDSSLSPASKSPLFKAGYNSNTVTNIDGVIELPVTYYTQLKAFDWKSKRILDLEGSTFEEMKSVIDQASNHNLCTVNILMHSFSFVRYGYPDTRLVERLEEILKYAEENEVVEVTTTENFYKQYQEGNICQTSQNFVPNTGVLLTYIRSIEDFDKGWKNKLVAIGGGGFAALVLVLIAYSLRVVYRKNN